LNNRRFAFFSSLFLIGGAVGCQAIFGIDDTTFSPSGGDDASSGDGASDGSIGDGAATDAPSGDAATNASLAFSPARLFITESETVDVAVTLARNGFTGAATITLASVADAGVTPDGGPDASGANGIGAPELTIPAGSNTGTLHVSAAATATLGLTSLDFTLSADRTSAVALTTLVGGAAGTVDTTFGTSGVVANAAGVQWNSVAIAADDSFYVTGGGWVVHHYFADGTEDTAFDNAMATALSGFGGTSTRIAVDGTTLAIGGQDVNSDFAIRKFTTAGVSDPTFGAAGIYYLQRGAGGFYRGSVSGLAFSAAHEILATGVNSDNNNGIALRFRAGATDTYAYGAEVALAGIRADTTGDLVVGGNTTEADAGATWFAQRLNATFGDAGVQTNGNPSVQVVARQMVVSPNQQIAMGGVTEYSLAGGFASFDQTTLAPALLVNIPHSGGSDDGFSSIAAQADSKLLLSGNGGGSMTNTFVRRYFADGGLDTSFGNAGQFTIGEMNFGPETFFYDLAVDSWGRIIVVGRNTALGGYITRLWP